MRNPESRIEEAILHTEKEVRLTAVSSVSRSHDHDETVMPLVIEAVEKYGRDHAFRILRDAEPRCELAGVERCDRFNATER